MGCTSYDPYNYEENPREDYLTKTIFESIMARKRAKIQDAYDAERKEREDREKELMRQQYLLDSINPRGPKSYVDNLINTEIPKMEFGNLASEEAIVNDLNDRECEEYGEGEKGEEDEGEMTEGELKEKQEQNKNEMEEIKRQLEEMNKKSEEEKNKKNKNKKKKADKDGFFGNKKENKDTNEEEKDDNKSEEEEEEEEEGEEKEEKNKVNKKNKKKEIENEGEELKEEEKDEKESEINQKGKNKEKEKNKKKNNIQKGDQEEEEEEEEENDERKKNNNKKKDKKDKINGKDKRSKNMKKNLEESELEEEYEMNNEENDDQGSEEKEKILKKKMQEKKRIKRQNKMKELMKLKAENPSYIDKIKKYKYPKREVEEKQFADFSPSPSELIICVIGELKNGKTSFIKKYTRNVFEEIYKKTENIDTYEEAQAEFDSKKIKLTIIDTPPLNDRKNTKIIQENGINKSHIIIYIVDINDEYAGFKVKLTIQNFEFNEKQIIAVIGNKSDKVSIFSKKNKETLGILCKFRKYIFEIISCQYTPKNEIENFINEKIIKEYFRLYY